MTQRTHLHALLGGAAWADRGGSRDSRRGPRRTWTASWHAWQKQQEGVRAVRIRAEGKRFIPKGGYTEAGGPEPDGKVRPPEDEATPLKEDLLLDFRSGRWRIVSESDGFGRRGPWLQVFDGKKVYGSKLNVPFDQAEGFRPNRMGIISGGDQINKFIPGEYPYFLSQGFILTNMDQS